MYILRVSNKAFIQLVEGSHDIVVVQEPERATKFTRPGDAMKAAAQIMDDWECKGEKDIQYLEYN